MDTFFRRALPLSLIAGAAALGFTGCGHDISTEKWQSPNKPSQGVIDTGAGWGTDAPPPSCPIPDPTVSPGQSLADTAACGSGPGGTTPPPSQPAIHNTNFCKVDAHGNIQSADQTSVVNEGSVVHSLSGGCISRPIREVWAVLLNDSVMKPDDVDDYDSTPRPDLVPSAGAGVEFVFDIHNVHHALGGVINPAWTVRWYHGIPHGTYAAPNEIAINFQKVEGTDHIRQLRGGYILDRTTDAVTSYVLEQWLDADQHGADDVTKDMARAFQRMREGAPNWGALPATPPVTLGAPDPEPSGS